MNEQKWPAGQRCRWLLSAVMSVALVGCASTIRQQKEAELAVVSASLDQSQAVLADLKSGAIPPDFDIHVFVKNDLFNQALAGVDGFSFDLPNDPSIKVHVGQIRINTYGALPAVTVKASANKDALSADIDLTAVLVAADPNSPGALKLKVLSFTPVVKWYFFELTKAKFVKALLAVQLNQITDRLPTIQLPIAQAVDLGAPARTQNVTLPTGRGSVLLMDVTAPATLKHKNLKVERYVFLESGIHVFGALQ